MNELILIIKLLFISSCALCIPFYFMHECYLKHAHKSRKFKHFYYRKVALYRNLIILCFSFGVANLLALILISI